jgi:hypothetical protein
MASSSSETTLRQRPQTANRDSIQAQRQSSRFPTLLNQSFAFTFSSQPPTREGHPHRSEHNLRPASTEDVSSSRAAHPSIQTPGQSSTVSIRPRMYGSNHLGSCSNNHSGRTVVGDSLSLENFNSYVDIMREAEQRLESMMFRWPTHAVTDALNVKVPGYAVDRTATSAGRTDPKRSNFTKTRTTKLSSHLPTEQRRDECNFHSHSRFSFLWALAIVGKFVSRRAPFCNQFRRFYT